MRMGKLFRPSNRIPEAWHENEYIKAMSPGGTKFKLGYHFYNEHMRVWMFGNKQHSPKELTAAGWKLKMPISIRYN